MCIIGNEAIGTGTVLANGTNAGYYSNSQLRGSSGGGGGGAYCLFVAQDNKPAWTINVSGGNGGYCTSSRGGCSRSEKVEMVAIGHLIQ